MNKNSNYWKIEAKENGRPKAGNVDHTNPDKDTVIFLMEKRGA